MPTRKAPLPESEASELRRSNPPPVRSVALVAKVLLSTAQRYALPPPRPSHAPLTLALNAYWPERESDCTVPVEVTLATSQETPGRQMPVGRVGA